MARPRVVILHGGDTARYSEWVERIARRLRAEGLAVEVAALVDPARVPAIRRAIGGANAVIALCSPAYRGRTEDPESPFSVFGDLRGVRCVPALGLGRWRDSAPDSLVGEVYADLTHPRDLEKELGRVVRRIVGAESPSIPALGIPEVSRDEPGRTATVDLPGSSREQDEEPGSRSVDDPEEAPAPASVPDRQAKLAPPSRPPRPKRRPRRAASAPARPPATPTPAPAAPAPAAPAPAAPAPEPAAPAPAASAPAERPAPEPVRVTAIVPAAVAAGARFRVEVVLHVAGFEVEAEPGREAEPGVASLPLREGAVVTVRLAEPDQRVFSIDDSEARMVWAAPAQRVDFRLRAGGDVVDGTYDLRLEYWVEGVQLARNYLEIRIGPAAGAAATNSVAHTRLPTSAFASYSRKDRARVAERVDSLKAVGIEVFVDSLDIQQGRRWQEVLERELLGREALLLFWSSAASRSEWVEKEWRYALEHHGLDAILPNALEPPADCPPPPELASLQFGSVLTELARHWAERDRPS